MILNIKNNYVMTTVHYHLVIHIVPKYGHIGPSISKAYNSVMRCL